MVGAEAAGAIVRPVLRGGGDDVDACLERPREGGARLEARAPDLSRGTRRVASGDADWPHTGLQRGVIVGVWPASCALSVLSRGGERLVVDPRLVRQGERVTCFEQRL